MTSTPGHSIRVLPSSTSTLLYLYPAVAWLLPPAGVRQSIIRCTNYSQICIVFYLFQHKIDLVWVTNSVLIIIVPLKQGKEKQ